MNSRTGGPAAGPRPTAPVRQGSAWANGIALLAAVAMLVAGGWVALVGFSALLGDALFARPGGYSYALDLSRWGWVLLLLGVLIAGAGIGVLQGGRWARVTGLVLALLSLVAAFLFVPYQPVWAVLVIVLDLLVVVALTAHRPAD
jgi:hypothetical protein